jgi:hypothetical protein
VLTGLAADNVKAVAEKLKDTGVATVQQLLVVLAEVREHATNNHAHVLCAELCAELKAIRKIACIAGADGEPSSFRQLLLDSCWPNFLEFIENRAPSSTRRQGVANVKYICELILRGLASPRLLITAAEMLLESFQTDKLFTEALECLMAILTAARQFDSQPGWIHKPRLDVVFRELETLVKQRAAPPTLCLLLGELISLRQAGWPTGKMRFPETQMRPVEARSVDREPPKPKKQVRHPAPTATDTGNMLTLAREMLLAPVTHNPKLRNSVAKAPAAAKEVKAQCEVKKKMPTSKTAPFNSTAFHKVLSILLRTLHTGDNVTSALQKIQDQSVPLLHQAQEFADLLTRAAEISREPCRLSAFQLAVALAESHVFDPAECLRGVAMFFDEVFGELCDEIPDLPRIVRTEMMPSLRAVFKPTELEEILPESI